MTNEVFESDPNSKKLTDLVSSGELVLFLGSGLSLDIYPSWSKLVREFCTRCRISPNVPLDEDTSVEILTELSEKALEADKAAFVEILRARFAKPITDKKKAYELLMGVSFKSFVTINFDPLLADENNCRQEYRARQLFKYPDIKTKYLVKQNLFYIHGYIAPGSVPNVDHLILTKAAFNRAYSLDGGPLSSFWDILLTEYPLLFLGCGLKEPELQMALRKGKKRKEMLRKMYAIQAPPLFILRPAYFSTDQALNIRIRDSGREEEEQSKFADLDIRIVRYDKRDDQHSGLLEVLELWNPQPPMNEYTSNLEAWACYE